MAIQPPSRPVPNLFDWLESNFPFRSPFASEEHAIRVEEYQDGDTYTIRAEIPGVDPDRDVEISVEHGRLTLAAERAEEFKEGKRSEFHYGYLTRTVALPEGVDQDDITADYTDGVLTIKARMRSATTARRKVAISKTSRPQTASTPAPQEGLQGVSTPEPSPGMPGVSDPHVHRPGNDVMGTGTGDQPE